MKIYKYLINFVLIMMLSSPNYAAETQSLSTIRQFVKAYLNEQIPSLAQTTVKTEIGSLDSRLRLTACDEDALTAFVPHGADPSLATTIGVRCARPKPWSLFVPVRVKMYSKVVTAARPLARGTALKPRDIKLTLVDVKKLRQSYFQDPKLLKGMLVKQPLSPGAVITPYHLQVPNVVHRGDAVLIRAAIDGVKVSIKGIALSNGQRGQTIQVRSRSSKKVISAKVLNKQEVQVML